MKQRHKDLIQAAVMIAGMLVAIGFGAGIGSGLARALLGAP